MLPLRESSLSSIRSQEFDSLQVKQEIDKQLNIWDNSKLFEYDLVVVQSKYDADWVECFVLHQLSISAIRTWSSIKEMSLMKRINDHMCLT
jgi:hypothetical protein